MKTTNQFILLESSSLADEEFDSRAELALALLKHLLEEDEIHVRLVDHDEDGSLIVEFM